MSNPGNGFPLSAAQRSIWFAQELDPFTPLTIAQYVDVRGPLDTAILDDAGRTVAEEFDTVMVRLERGDSEPRQIVDRTLRDKMVHLDLRDRDDPVSEALAWMSAEFAAPFDMYGSRLIEVATLRIGEDRWFWYTRIHHVLLDGYGATVFADRVAELYTAAVTGGAVSPNKAGSVADLVADEAAYRQSTRFDRDALYWAERTADLGPPVRLAESSGRYDVRSRVVGAQIEPALYRAVDDACSRWNTTVPALVAAATALYVARMADVSDLSLSLPVSARTNALLRRSGGMVSNVVPVRAHIGSATTVASLVDVTGREIMGGLRHQRYRFEDMRAATQSTGIGTGRGFFGTPVNIMTFRSDTALGPCTGRAHILTTGPIDDLAVNVHTGAGGLRIDLEANPTAYGEAELEGHHRRLLDLLTALVSSSGDDVAVDLPMGRAVVPTRSGPPAIEPALLPDMFDRTVRLHGDRVAVVAHDRRDTYRELDARANRLARVLVDHGVGPGTFVAVLLRRGLHSVTAELAVTKAGGAFVPIDPQLPDERIDYLLADSGVLLGISDEPVSTHPGITWLQIGSPILTDEFLTESPAPVLDAERTRPLHVDDPAYMIYTSGSTGLPKGVVVGHRGLASFSAEQIHRYGVGSNSRTLHFASPSFDASVLELLLAIASGATMVIAPTDVYGGEDLWRLLVTERVTHAFVTPAALASVDPAGTVDLEVVIVGGEACAPTLAERWAPGRRMYNAYGPTECTVMATVAGPLVPGQRVTIGGPITGTSIAVLDHRLRPVPDGGVGELYVLGASIGIGYHARAGLTAARFIANPLDKNGSRIYRTGDVVRVNADDTYSYLGRSDDQIKVRGFRIELGEVDAALHDVTGVVRGVADVRTVAGQPTLVAYVEPDRTGSDELGTRVVEYLRNVLPAHSVPSAVVVVDTLPLTTSGKVDRRALPTPDLTPAEHVAPRTPTERAVAEIVASVLGPRPGGQSYGAGDDFFALGGNSLLATRLTSLLGTKVGVHVPMRVVFEAPTVAGMASALDAMAVDASTGGRVRRPLTRAEGRVGPALLSPAQHRMWVSNQFDTRLATYNVPIVLRLRGPIDIRALGFAVTDLVGRHETLRTSYPDTPDGPVQQVHDVDEASALVDIVTLQVSEEDAARRALDVAMTGFDVSREIPLRIELLEIEPNDVVLVCVVHHIGADGSSTLPLARDLATAYRARREGGEPDWPALPVTYADYTMWHHDQMGRDTDPDSLASQQLAYWKERLRDLPERLDLPFDRPRPAVASLRGGRVVRRVHAAQVAALAQCAAAHSTTPFMVVHAALAALLARMSGTIDIAVGTPVAGRDDPATENLVGMFVGTVVLRSQVDDHRSFADLLRQIREHDLEAFENSDVPFERIVELLNPPRAASHHPLVQVGFSYQNLAPVSFELDDIDVEVVDLETSVAKFDLHMTVVERSSGLDIQWEYAHDLFDHNTVERFADLFADILDAAMADPTAALGDLAVATPTEVESVGTVTDEPACTVADLLAAGLVEGAGRIAIVEDETGTETSYEEIAARIHRSARALISHGVAPGTRVLVALPRSARMIEAVWAVVLAGGTYVPLDPNAPGERAATVVGSSGAKLAIAESDCDAINFGTSVDTLDLRTLSSGTHSSAPLSDADRIAPLRPAHDVYVIYTSGSTGTPKGVALSHGAVAHQLRWKTRYYPSGPDDAGVLKTPLTFDLSVWELFGPVLSGARTVVARPDGHRDPRYISDLLRRNEIGNVHFVPSLLVAHLDTAPGRSTRIMCIGEALPAATADLAMDATGAVVDNLYGPTEAAVGVTVHRRRHRDDDHVGTSNAGASVPIGRPMSGTGVHVLDRRLHPVPAGVPGELYLSGAQLASHYEGRPDLTAERFVANAFGAGDRMYRTGDLVRLRGDGELEFLSRNDSQFKLRGQRIELGEIEAALTRDSRIGAVAVVVLRGQRLHAYVVPDAGTDVADLSTVSVTERVRGWLPVYMIPSGITVLEALPRTTNGKLDRDALPEPVLPETGASPPNTATEHRVAHTFRAVLGIDGMDAEGPGIDDDFFDLGGNSLAATRLAARLGADLGADVPVSAVFESPTVRGLAHWIDAAGHQPRPALVARPRIGPIPLSRSQSRMWILNQLDLTSPLYNLPLAVRLTGALDIDAMTAAIHDVVERHEVLRTVYPAVDGEPTQRVLPLTDTTESMASELDVETTVRRGFDVTVDPPVRWTLDRGSDGATTLVVVVHHIAADAGSFRPLLLDVLAAYSARTSGEPFARPTLPVQYADHAMRERDLLGTGNTDRHPSIAQRYRFWEHTLAHLPGPLPLPTDRPRPPVPTHAGASVLDEIDPDTVESLRSVAGRDRTTVFAALHSALAVTLSRLSGTSDIVIGTPVDGRGLPELDDLVGMFVSTVALRIQVDAGATVRRTMTRSRDALVAALAASEVPFEDLVTMLPVDRSAAHHPIFQVMLSIQEALPPAWDHDGLHVEVRPLDLPVARFDLHITVDEPSPGSGRPLGIRWTYATDLFDESTVTGFAAAFRRVLDALVRDAPTPVGDLDLLGPSRRAEISEWSAGPDTPDSNRTLADVIRPVGAHPVLTMAGKTLDADEFARAVARTARGFITEGVGPGAVVGVALPRSIELMIVMHAVITAGGAALPLDLEQPSSRLLTMADLAEPMLIVAPDEARIPASLADLVRTPAQLDSGSDEPVTDRDRVASLHSSHPAYVIFTSGSTGEPKGVAVPHAGIVNRLDWMQAKYPIGAGDTVLHKTPVTFDVSVWELYWGFANGARTVVAEPDAHRDPARIASIIDAEGITVVHFVPSVLDVFLASTESRHPTLRLLFTSGEALGSSTATRARMQLPATVHNLYGPTEAAVDVTAHEVGTEPSNGLSVPIGRPVARTRTLVLDTRMNPVDSGVAGELYLGGVQLALGYVSRAALTAGRFVADPYDAGNRLYRTGDLVRWSRTVPGVLEFLGRTDFQVKIRGLRIELGEIEAALRRHPAVARVVVVVRAELSAAGEVVAYVVPESGRFVDHEIISRCARDQLPEHMIPSRTVILDELPLGSAGKIDRRALPAPVRTERTRTTPRTDTERVVLEVVRSAVDTGHGDVESIGVDSDFFDVGGTSLTAAVVVSGIAHRLGVDIGLRTVFEFRSAALLAELVDAGGAQTTLEPNAVAEESLSMTAAQRRMWVHNRIDPSSAAYNIVLPLTVPGRDVDMVALGWALRDVVCRHEALRTIYPDNGDGPSPLVLAEIDDRACELLVRVVTEDEQTAVVTTGFDLTTDVPVRLVVVPKQSETLLVLVVHHIAADGWSMRILGGDLVHAYAARSTGEIPEWAAPAAGFHDRLAHRTAGAKADRGAQIARWIDVLRDAPVLGVPIPDHPRPLAPTYRGAIARAHTDGVDRDDLLAVASRVAASPFAVLYAALITTLARSGAGDDIVLGLPTAGRADPASRGTVGMFVTMVTLRDRYRPTSTFTESVQHARDVLLDALHIADVDVEDVVDAVAAQREPTHHPIFQMTLDVDDSLDAASAPAGVSVTDMDIAVARFDLEFTARRRPEGNYDLTLIYRPDLYDASTAQVLLDRWVTVLAAVVESPDRPVREIDVRARRERPTDPPTDCAVPARTFPELLRGSGSLTDGATGRTMSTAEVQAAVARLARLIIGRGLGVGDVVAVCMSRSVDAVVAVRAVAEAGVTVVPIDPSTPPARIAHMLADSGARAVVTVHAYAAVCDSDSAVVVDSTAVLNHLDGLDPSPVTDAERVGSLHVDATAYLIYTSGSTGTPKAVAVSHRGLAAFTEEQRTRFEVRPEHRVLRGAAQSFDASILELLLASSAGAELVVAPADLYGGDDLAELLVRGRITHAFLTPGALDTIALDPTALDGTGTSAFPNLEVVVVGGDACPPELARRWVRSGIRLFNAYGPTESTIAATVAGPIGEITGSVPIGIPVRDTTVQVLDAALSVVPSCVVGELYVGGAGVADGYHGRPALTAATFVANPFGPPGSRAFRTGDLVRWSEGALFHHGRSDFQLKIRGQRVEIGEIESALRDDPTIAAGAVVVRDLGVDRALVAYVTAVAGCEVDVTSVRTRLAETLPRYMVPVAVTTIDELPLTRAGKIDLDALPEPVLPRHEFVAPASDLEVLVAGVFTDVLGTTRISAADNFFDLGGDSLSATRVVSRVRAATGRAVAVRTLFDSPDVRTFAQAVAESARDVGPVPGTVAVPDRIPLSLAQQRMWFLNRLDPSSTAENIPLVMRLTGELDEAAFGLALSDLVRRHAVLRTVYPDSEEGPHQVVLPPDCAAGALLTRTATSQSYPELVRLVVDTEFDVTREPPVRAELLRVEDPGHAGDREYLCALVFHHIAVDGVSVVRLAEELAFAYAARTAGLRPDFPPLALTYIDFAVWQRATLAEGSAPVSVEERFWRSTLAAGPAAVDLPFDRPRPAVMSGRGSRTEFSVDADVHAAMRDWGAATGASVFMIAHTALAVLLSRIGDNADVLIGTPVSGRGDDRFDPVVGMFVNMVTLRAAVDPAATGNAVLQSIRETDLAAFAHAETPFDRVVAMLDPPRTRAHHPLFQVALSFQNIGRLDLQLPGLTIDVVDTDTAVAEFELHLTLAPSVDGSLDAQLAYSTDVFDHTTVDTIATRYVSLLRSLVASPTTPVGDLDIAVGETLALIDSTSVAQSNLVLPQSFLDRAALEPSEIAIVDGPSEHSYGALCARVRELAEVLVHRGVGPHTTVAVALPRSVDQIVALYAVVAAGGAYVPVYPADRERTATVLAAAAPAVVIAETDASSHSVFAGLEVVAVGDRTSGPVALPVPRALDTAYVLFTSGSTGVPKGVAVPHRAVTTQLQWMQHRYRLTSDDAVLLHTPAGFDLSVWEYWWALGVGARIVLAPEGSERDAAATAQAITDSGVTVLCLVPTSLAMLLERPTFPPTVRLVLCIGEVLPADLCRRLAAVSNAAVHNLYGPTEATVSVTGHEVIDADGSGATVPIGTAQPAVGVRVLDRRLRPVPRSTVGELYVTGDQLARGYHADPARTATSFVADPYSPSTRMYRTGDLVRMRTDGSMDYISRADRQVKVQGFRIEPGEIESALRKYDDVDEAVVGVVASGTADAWLVAHVVGTADLDLDALPGRLRGALPEYMIPRRVLRIDSIPTTANGKVDRSRLPLPEMAERPFRAARTREETVVANALAEVTSTARVGLDDNFFELGGTSLGATRVIALVEKQLGRAVPVRVLFDHHSVEDVAADIETRASEHAIPLVRLNGDPDVRLAPSQERIRVAMAQRATGDWNVPFAVRLEAAIDLDALRGAIADVVTRHESLRTLHPTGPDGYRLDVVAADAARIEVLAVDCDTDRVAAELRDFGWRPFDVETQLPLRASIFRLSSDVVVLALVVHHLSADGQSMGPLVADMLGALAARNAGRTYDVPPPAIRFRDFAAWRRNVLGSTEDENSEYTRQLAYWVERLGRTSPRPQLRTDRPKPASWQSEGAVVELEIGADLHRDLVAYAGRLGSGSFAVFQAAFAVVLADVAGDGDVSVATANSNRPHPDLEHVVGNFSEDVPMRLDVRDDVEFADLVVHVRKQLSAALSAPDISAPTLLDALGITASLAENPLFPATLIVQDALDTGDGIDIGGTRISPVVVEGTVAKHELEVTLREHRSGREPNGVTGNILYPVALFDESTVRRVADAMIALLTRVVDGSGTPTVGELREDMR
ncbi:amino acid adenylation domain-containing protein [Rhodococcus sp. IEGM 1381]|uniref:non-ribosomal peptide synthetase n=1 Tax=Rhodococcus sp. IEGM 1381 TaxID=3047085 RepID=UPI0024B81A02|nr:non-ribosomal peptide synthetase [Rhodococcus sp. IEGM 1381]MDI9893956.1 amino acid adenylation domain-containing protein [Rhodococcus sp. IEGM 1381]